MRFFGLQHIPARGGALLVYNHVSVLDPLFVALGASRRGRPVRFLVLIQDYERGWVGWSLRRTRQIPIRRDRGNRQAIEQVTQVLRSGRLAGMAPEGSVGDGTEVRPGKSGAARISLGARAPVVPVGIWGTQARWGLEGLSKKVARLPVAVVFGAPLPLEGDPRSVSDTAAMTQRIMASIGQVAERARAEYRPGTGPAPR
jgi:1-acyl-sn-glycerol-3-phosphate acyltransferase